MSSSDFNTELIQALQAECFQENVQTFQQFLEALQGFAGQPSGSVKELFRISHTLKGNLQAAGLLEFAELVHRLETNLGTLEIALTAADFQSHSQVEVSLSSCLEGFQFYSQGLKEKDPVMEDAGKQAAIHHLKSIEKLLDGGSTNVVASAPVADAVVADEISVSAQKPEPEIVQESTPEVEEVASVIALKTDGPIATTTLDGHYLLCRVGSSRFAIPLTMVIEIVETNKYTALDLPVTGISGLYQVKEHCIPVVKLVATPSTEKHPFIVVCVMGSHRFGVHADEVMDVVSLHDADFQPNPRSMSITGIAELRHVMIRGEHTIFRVEFGGALFGEQNVA